MLPQAITILGALIATWGMNTNGKWSRAMGTYGSMVWSVGVIWVFGSLGVTSGFGWLFASWILANGFAALTPNNRNNP